MRSRFVVFFLLYVFLVTNLYAGSNPVGSSSTKGYFLGYLNAAYLEPDTSKSHVQEIERICKKQGKFWALGIDLPFTCTRFSFPEEGSDDPAYSVKLRSPSKLKESNHALLFSTKPFPKPSWKVRGLTSVEMKQVVFQSAHLDDKYIKALRNANAEKAKVIELLNRKATIIVLPLNVLSDGDIEEEVLLLTTDARGTKTLTLLLGEIVGFADLDRDGFPELQISLACDGRCESVISVWGHNNIRLNISVH